MSANSNNDDPVFMQRGELVARIGMGTRIVLVVAFVLVSLLVSKYVYAITTITSPVDASTLTSDTVEFSWTTNNNGIRGYQVYIGSQYGLNDLYDSEATVGEVQSPLTVTGLPADGSPVFLQIYRIRTNGVWRGPDEYSYTGWDGVGGTTDGGTTDGGIVSEVKLDAESMAALADITTTGTLALETLVVLGACLSFFMGWKNGMSR